MQVVIDINIPIVAKALRCCGAVPPKELTDEEVKEALLDFLECYGVKEVDEVEVYNRGKETMLMWCKQKIEDIKAEIKQWYWQADKQALAKDPCVVDAMVDLFLRTVDKHINGKEQK